MNISTNINNATTLELSELVSIENDINFFDLSILPSGYGHYQVKLIIDVDGKTIELVRTTNNMPLIDAYKSQVHDGDFDEDYDNPTLLLIDFCYDEEIIEQKLADISEDE